jgi:hypothetical protein
MPAAIFTRGSLAEVLIAPVPAALTKPILGNFKSLCIANNATITVSDKSTTITQFCQGDWESDVVTGQSWNVNLGQPDWAVADLSVIIVEDAVFDATKRNVWIEVRPLGTGAALKEFDGPGNISGWSLTIPKDGLIKMPFIVKGLGVLNRGVQA